VTSTSESRQHVPYSDNHPPISMHLSTKHALIWFAVFVKLQAALY
jgi:hypothetical protein